MGTFKATRGNDACTPCSQLAPHLTTAALGADTAALCICESDSYERVESLSGTISCVCRPGSGLVNETACETCAVGSYKAGLGMDPCTSCADIDPHLSTASEGATAVDDCVCAHASLQQVGTGSSAQCMCPVGSGLDSSLGQCEVCPYGTYSGALSTAPCTSCTDVDPHLTTRTLGSTQLSDCVCLDDIFVLVGSGASMQCLCPAGYEYDAFNMRCVSTPPGAYKVGLGNLPADLCSSIDPHLTTTTIGATSETACVCAHDSFELVGNGASALCLCPPGSGYDATSMTCCPCPRGTYKPFLSNDACTRCSDMDEHLTTLSESSLTDGDCVCDHISLQLEGSGTDRRCTCPAHEGYDAENGQCEPCPSSTFKQSAGRTSCTPCAEAAASSEVTDDGRVIPPSSCSCEDIGFILDTSDGPLSGSCYCDEGRRFDRTAVTCTPCAHGTFKKSAGNTGCSKCKPGFYINETGATSCDECSAGFYNAQEGAAECTLRCPANTFSFARAVECTACGNTSVSHGGNCSRGSFQGAAEGFWAWPVEGEDLEKADVLAAVAFYACHEPQFCAGGTTSACNGGRVGPLCSLCPPRTRRWLQGECVDCGSSVTIPLYGLALIAVGATLACLGWARLTGWWCYRQADIAAMRRVVRSNMASSLMGLSTTAGSRDLGSFRRSARMSMLTPRGMFGSSEGARRGHSSVGGTARGDWPTTRSSFIAGLLSARPGARSPPPGASQRRQSSMAMPAMGMRRTRRTTLAPGSLVGQSLSTSARLARGILRATRFFSEERCKILLAYLQILSTLSPGYGFPWPSAFGRFVVFWEGTMLGLRGWGIGCVTMDNLYVRFALRAAVLLTAVAVTTRGFALCPCDGASKAWDRALFRARVFAFIAAFPIMSASVLELYPCTSLGADTQLITADMSLACTSRSFAAFATMGALFGAIYTLGIPGYFLWALLRAQRWPELPWQSDEEFVRNLVNDGVRTGRIRRESFMASAIHAAHTRAKPFLDILGTLVIRALGPLGDAYRLGAQTGGGAPSRSTRLEDRRSTRTLGVLYVNFRKGYWAWEFVDMARKVTLAAVLPNVARNSQLQALFALGGAMAYALLTAACQPYRQLADYRLAQACNIVHCLLFLCGLATRGTGARLTGGQRTAYSVLLCLVACIPILVALVPREPAKRAVSAVQRSTALFLMRHQHVAPSSGGAGVDGKREWLLSQERRLSTQRFNAVSRRGSLDGLASRRSFQPTGNLRGGEASRRTWREADGRDGPFPSASAGSYRGDAGPLPLPSIRTPIRTSMVGNPMLVAPIAEEAAGDGPGLGGSSPRPLPGPELPRRPRQSNVVVSGLTAYLPRDEDGGSLNRRPGAAPARAATPRVRAVDRPADEEGDEGLIA